MKFVDSPFFNRQLKRFQSILKTDIRYLLLGGAYLTIGQIFASVAGLILTISLVKLLDKSEYGLYSYILSLAAIVGSFSLSGIDTGATQAVAKGFDRTIISGFWMKLRWGIPITAVSFGIGGYYLYNGNEILGYSFIIIGAFSPILYASSLYGAYLNGKKQFRKLAIDNTFKNLCLTASMVLTAFFTHGVISIIFAYFFTNTAISLIRYLLIAKRIQKNVDGGGSDVASLRFGKHLSLMDAFSNIATHVDKIIVFQLLGATQLAIYTLAHAPVKQLHGLSKVIRTLVIPKFSTRTVAELKQTLPHKFRIFLLASFIIVVFYNLIISKLFDVLFPDYSEAILYSQALSLTLLCMPMTLYTQALTALGRKKELYILHITKPFYKIVPLLILAPMYGIWGTIIAFLFFYILHYATLLILFSKVKTKESPSNLDSVDPSLPE